MISISIRNLSKNFGDTVALDNVSLTIQAGEMFFLLGPSGCGKTTLLRHIAGFYTPDKGRLLFDAKDITDLPAHKRNTAMMFQSYALWPHLTVGENVAFGLNERKLPKKEVVTRVQESLALVKMGHLGDRKINQLSGGQQQRVALARSIAVRPDALLLDEPLSNLDAKLRLEMRGEIRRICKEFGVTAVYVTHDQKEALHLADRMAIMEKGIISQVGTPREIYREPRSSSVAEFIGEANFLSAELIAPAGHGPFWTARSLTHGVFTGRVTDPEWSPRAGDHARLCIRPESLRLTDQPAGGNVLSGKLTESLYLGEMAQYRLRDESGVEITLSEINPVAPRAAEGSPLRASVSPDDVMILRP